MDRWRLLIAHHNQARSSMLLQIHDQSLKELACFWFPAPGDKIGGSCFNQPS
jgi:hypothetical protein